MQFIAQGKTNWKFLLIVFVFVIIAGGGTFWFVKNFKLPEVTVKNETAGWQTLKNEQISFVMRYPTEHPMEFFQSGGNFGPKITSMACDVSSFSNKCPIVPLEGFTGDIEDYIKQGFIKSERTSANGASYCLQISEDAGAGTLYKTYNYITPKDGKCVVVLFTVPYPNCQNYLPTENSEMQKEYEQCVIDNEVTKPTIINQMLSTFKFIK